MERKNVKIFVDESLLLILDRHIEYSEITTLGDYHRLFNLIFFFVGRDSDTFSISTAKYKKNFRKMVNKKTYDGLKLMMNKLQEVGLIKKVQKARFNCSEPNCNVYILSQMFYDEYFKMKMSLTSIDISKFEHKKLSKYLTVDEDDGCQKQYNLMISDRVDFDWKRFSLDLLDSDSKLSKEIDSLRIGQKASLLTSITNFKNKFIFVSKGKNSSRIYSSFANMKSITRDYVTIDNKSLKSIDLKSSQPLLYVHLLNKVISKCEDLDRLTFIVKELDVYEWFTKEYIRITGSNIVRTFNEQKGEMDSYELDERNEIKQFMYRFLFSSSNKHTGNPVNIVFKNSFPTLFSVIGKIKSELKEDNRSLAAELQKLEANIFLPVAFKFVDKGALSVHDAIYCKEEMVDIIEKKLKLSLKENEIDGYELKRN